MLLNNEQERVTHTHCNADIKTIRMNKSSQNWEYTVCSYPHNCIKWKQVAEKSSMAISKGCKEMDRMIDALIILIVVMVSEVYKSKLIWFYTWNMCSLLHVKSVSMELLKAKACGKGVSMWPEAKFLSSLCLCSFGGQNRAIKHVLHKTFGCISGHRAACIHGEHIILSLLQQI